MRWIGIRHRVKMTKEEESRPTQVVIHEGDAIRFLDLADDQEELLWAFGKLNMGQGLTDGLTAGDNVALILGGSGDRLAFALSRRADEVAAKVFRIPAFQLKGLRPGDDKDQDAGLLAKTLKEKPELFYPVGPRDRKLIWAIECFRARQEAMKARIACEQRLFSNFIGRVFCRENGLFPEGSIEVQFNLEKANDAILKALEQEEAKRERSLLRALEELEVYNEVFNKIEGCGPAIGGRLIAAIQDIRRFETDSQLKAFCGVHILDDGRFARRRHGEVANWHPDARQALYLLADQFKYRPNTPWGQKLREYKAKLREKHPEVEIVNGKKRYTDGHIHKMALWRTVTKFVEWLWKEWWELEKKQQQ